MFKSVVFLGRKNCQYSYKLYKLLKKNSKKIFYYETNKRNEDINFNLKGKFDYLFSFRSFVILKKNILKKIKHHSINFHPGPPKYRGIGCTNFAIFNNEKNYGATAHHIDDKIDHGKIIEVINFRIKKNENLENLLSKTHKQMYKLAVKVIKNLLKNKNFYDSRLGKYKWSKKLWKLKDLDRLYEIKINDNKKTIFNKIKATKYKHFSPYLKIKNLKFILD
tara:strand:+ start:573 stop:1235 length:663 start_codon:yes stop_codon:yes gene_type:complete